MGSAGSEVFLIFGVFFVTLVPCAYGLSLKASLGGCSLGLSLDGFLGMLVIGGVIFSFLC